MKLRCDVKFEDIVTAIQDATELGECDIILTVVQEGEPLTVVTSCNLGYLQGVASILATEVTSELMTDLMEAIVTISKATEASGRSLKMPTSGSAGGKNRLN